MSKKNKKKEITLAELEKSLQFFNIESKEEISKLVDEFSKVQKFEDIEQKKVDKLFNLTINVCGNLDYLFLLDLYAKFYNKKKGVPFLVIESIKSYTNNQIKIILPNYSFDGVIESLKDSKKDSNKLKILLTKIKELSNENIGNLVRFGILIYVYLLILSKETYPSECNEIVKKIEKTFYNCYLRKAKITPDILFIINKTLFAGNHIEKFDLITKNYVDIYEDNKKNDYEIQQQQIFVQDKIKHIQKLEKELELANSNIQNYLITINKKESNIKDLEEKLVKADGRNEYDENLYKQQYLSLKKNLVDKIKKELKLEIDGIEDIADTLSDATKTKIQRRIDRIYKAIEKIGE